MKNKGITVVIAILAVILAGLVGLLIYLEMGRPEAQTPETQAPSGTAESTGAAVEDTTSAAETEAVETEGEADATPMVPAIDPEMDPQGATEGPQVDPTLGQDETRDPDENELPMVG